MDFLDYLKHSQRGTTEDKQPKCKSKENTMNQTSRNTGINQSFSNKNNNTTGRMQYYPKLPNILQEYDYHLIRYRSSKRNKSEYLSDYAKAIVFCEDYFIQNKIQMNNAEEYKRKLIIKLKGLFRASYRLALFKEIEKYIDFCLMKEINSDHQDKCNLNSQLYSLKEDVAIMHDNNHYNGMKPIVNETKPKKLLNNNNYCKHVNNKDNKNELKRTISFENDCFDREINSTHNEKNSNNANSNVNVSNNELDNKREQINFIKKILEKTSRKPKRKPRPNASVQKHLQNSLFSSIYDNTNSECSFQLSSNHNKVLNKSNPSLNKSESSLIATNNNSKFNHSTLKSKHPPNKTSKQILLSNSTSIQNTKKKQIECNNYSQCSLMPKQTSKLSSKIKSFIQYQPQLEKPKPSIKKSSNSLKKNFSCPNYQEMGKPKKRQKISLIQTASKQAINQPMNSIKDSSRFQFDLSCYRKLTDSKKKMTLKHIVLYFSLRLKINSLLLMLLKTASIYNRNIKRRAKPLKHNHTHAISLITHITKNYHYSPYKKVILPIPSFTKGNQPNGKVLSSNESSFRIKKQPTFKE